MFSSLRFLKNVSFLCKQLNYFLKEEQFEQHPKDFSILQIPVSR